MELVRCKSISISYSDKEAEALAAGANYVVLITFKKVKDGWTMLMLSSRCLLFTR
jgi:hypothetical protein